MTDQTIMAIVLTAFSVMIICWAWYLYTARKNEIAKKLIEKPAKRPRLYKQATVVTKGELPRKAPVKTVVKKPATKKTKPKRV
jgi:hypothetical protein